MNLVLEGQMGAAEAAVTLGLSERHTWRILAAYRREGAIQRWLTGIVGVNQSIVQVR